MIVPLIDRRQRPGSFPALPNTCSELRLEVSELGTALSTPLSRTYADWLRLFEADPRAAIQHHPAYTAMEFAATPSAQHPGLLFTCHRGTELEGLAATLPKVSRTSSVGGLGPACNLHGSRLVGNELLGSPEPAVRAALVGALAEHLRSERTPFLLIEDLEQTSPLLESFAQLKENGFAIYSPTDFQVRLRIQLPRTGDEYWGKFSSKTRNTFRRKDKKLGETRLVRVSTLEQIPDFLAQAHQISRNTWQSEQLGLRVRNDQNELRIFTFLAMHGALRSYLLFQDEQPIAFLIGNQHHGKFHYEEVGYDRAFGHLSPGQCLLLKVLEDLFADNRPDLFDFGFGDADYKRIFANHETRSGNVWVVPPGWRNRGVLGYLQACRTAKQVGRAALARAGWFTRLRQRLRAGSGRPVAANNESQPV